MQVTGMNAKGQMYFTYFGPIMSIFFPNMVEGFVRIPISELIFVCVCWFSFLIAY